MSDEGAEARRTATRRLTAGGAMAGGTNLLRREAATWWRGRRWLRHSVVWAAIHGGLLTLMLWVLPAVIADTGPTGDAHEAAIQLPDLAAVVAAIGVVLLAQGLLLDERRSGVLEWLLSKPVGRPAVVVAKFAGHGSGLVASVVVLPWLVVHALLSVAAGQLWSPLRSLAVIGVLALVVVFHLALVLALGTATSSRVAILAVPIVAIVTADGLVAVWPELFDVLPWSLGAVASVLWADGALVSGWPIVATVGWTLALLAAGAALLQRAEL